MHTDTHTQASPVLFTHYGDHWIRGSERCLLDLLTHLDRRLYRPVVWCNSPVMADAVRALGITVHRSNFSLLLGWRRPRLSLRDFFTQVHEGLALVDRYQIKLLHANSGAPAQWLNVVARARRLPLVCHLHTRYPWRDRATLGLHHTTVTVGVSRSVIDALLQDGSRSDRTRIIPNGIDGDRLDRQPRIDLRRRLGLRMNDRLIATVGSLIRRKGVDLLIRALGELIGRGVPARLVIIGDGSERAELVRLSEALDIADHVYFLGEQKNIMGLLSGNADLFASGAREEAFGLVLAEAGAAALPVVAPAVGGIPDVVEDGVTGYLVDANDASALASGIERLLLDKVKRTQMGLAGQRWVSERFTIQRNVRQFECLYRTLLTDPDQKTGWFRQWQIGQVLLGAIRRILTMTLSIGRREAAQ